MSAESTDLSARPGGVMAMSKTSSLLAVGVALVALVGLGCGASGQSSPGASGSAGVSSGAAPAGGSGGVGGSGAGQGGTGGSAGANASGGTLTLGDSLTEGCIAYALAVCSRDAECGMTSSKGCVNVANACPDLIGSPGATRTPAGLKACAETYKAFPCEQLEQGARPDCVTPGLRATGEPCSYPSQCSSLICKGSDGGGTCGICARAVGVGESCSEQDVGCGVGSECDEGVCVSLPAPPTRAGPNEACTAASSCVTGYYCALNGGQDGVCAPLPAAGQPCAGLRCGDQAYCKHATTTCMAYPGLGEPCGVHIDLAPDGFYCAEGLVCNGVDLDLLQPGTCVSQPKLGEPCILPPNTPPDNACAAGLHCDFVAVPPVCLGFVEAGGSCESDFDCKEGLSCSCAARPCEQRTCGTLRFGGEACSPTDLANHCHPAFDCTEGVCTPAELRGVFAKACGL